MCDEIAIGDHVTIVVELPGGDLFEIPGAVLFGIERNRPEKVAQFSGSQVNISGPTLEDAIQRRKARKAR